jgi:hypothetical protein
MCVAQRVNLLAIKAVDAMAEMDEGIVAAGEPQQHLANCNREAR